MFSWHETTLRGLCRLAFGLLVAVPTCAVLLAVVWCRCPLSVEYHRRALAEQLALDVALQQVSFPLPNVTQFAGLTLIDPETARPLARFASLEWRTSGQKSTVTCGQAELLDSSRLDLLAELVGRRLRAFAGSSRVVEIQVEQLILHLADGVTPQVLIDVRGQLRPESSEPSAEGAPSEPQGTLEFRLQGQEAEAPAQVSLYRNRAELSAAIAMRIETGPTPLPSRLIALCCPAWETWGLGSSFCGELAWQRRADGWAGEARGQVTGVDLHNLVATRSSHELTGVAEVRLEHARFQRGRLLDASGSVHAGPGLVARSLLAAAAEQLHATGNDPTAARGDQTAYEQLAFGFAIDQRGLVIRGLCPQPRGAIFVGRVGPLLGDPPRPQPLLGLVRMLAILGDAVPADPGAQALLRVLPLPATSGGLHAEPQVQLKQDLRR